MLEGIAEANGSKSRGVLLGVYMLGGVTDEGVNRLNGSALLEIPLTSLN